MLIRKQIVNNMGRGFKAASALADDAQTIVADVMAEIVADAGDKLNKNTLAKKVRGAVNATLAQYVKEAAKKDKAIGAKGFNCKDMGNSRYYPENPMHLHMVDPKGGVKPGVKITSALNHGLVRFKELDYSMDAWNTDKHQFSPQKASTPSKAKKAKGVPKYLQEFSKSLSKELITQAKENGWNRATAQAKLNSALEALRS